MHVDDLCLDLSLGAFNHVNLLIAKDCNIELFAGKCLVLRKLVFSDLNTYLLEIGLGKLLTIVDEDVVRSRVLLLLEFVNVVFHSGNHDF